MKPIHALGLIPFIGMLGGLPFANKATPLVLGMPFLLFWIVLWVILTSAVMAIVNFIDPADRKEDV
ncbi:DUF3311 domain-containing protein [Paenibacillus sp. MZ04-78.2]|uniref:DUF3311 domain-containing protein n=1 Tax=Paenibacillus sp. MZ04-78.2 TaxID=2962034 RepID=UPI0020B7A6F7|nr:DUF3311 domain-containing protein [Paenibacillus sp. MZ04-78.2]MCP3773596.1 DUF3311 domain-containing protein [Paenibacillus sp. MZ04-78.2]